MNELFIEEEFREDIVILKLKGMIDSGTSQSLEKRFQDMVDSYRVRIIVDMSEVDYVASAGWGIFISEIKEIRGKGGDLKLFGMKSAVRDVFDLLEFDTLITPYHTREEALGSFREKENSRQSE